MLVAGVEGTMDPVNVSDMHYKCITQHVFDMHSN